MPAFELSTSAFELVVGQLEASMERARWPEQAGFAQVPQLSRDAEGALRSAVPAQGSYRVTCDRLCAQRLAEWFERMEAVIERTRTDYDDPRRLATVCAEAVSTIRSACPQN